MGSRSLPLLTSTLSLLFTCLALAQPVVVPPASSIAAGAENVSFHVNQVSGSLGVGEAWVVRLLDSRAYTVEDGAIQSLDHGSAWALFRSVGFQVEQAFTSDGTISFSLEALRDPATLLVTAQRTGGEGGPGPVLLLDSVGVVPRPALASLVLSADPWISGRDPLTATVTLSSAPAFGGCPVILDTSIPRAFGDGSTSRIYWVPAGSTSIDVELESLPVADNTGRRVTARVIRATDRLSANDWIIEDASQFPVAAPISGFAVGLSVPAGEVLAGGPVVATITVTEPAPPWGLVVEPAFDSPAWAFQDGAFATLPGGATSVEVTLSTQPRTSYTNSAVGVRIGTVFSNQPTLLLRPDPLVVGWQAHAEETAWSGEPIFVIVFHNQAEAPTGFTFALSSSDVTVPDTLTTPAGQAFGSVEVTAPVVTSEQMIAITVAFDGDFDGVAEEQVLQIRVLPGEEPPVRIAPILVTVEPAQPDPGDQLTITVQLQEPAGPLGEHVDLLYSGAFLNLMDAPLFLVFAEGQQERSFQPSRLSTTVAGYTVGIEASNAAGSASTAFTVTRPPGPAFAQLAWGSGGLACDQPVFGHVTLSEPAPAGGTRVEVSGISGAAVALPWYNEPDEFGEREFQAFTIPAGESEGTFLTYVDPEYISNGWYAAGFPFYVPQVAIGIPFGEGTEMLVPEATSIGIRIASIELGLPSADGPASVAVSVNLTDPAPPGGAIVPLELEPAGRVGGPVYLTFPEGTSFVGFVIDVAEAPEGGETIIIRAHGCNSYEARLPNASVPPPQLVGISVVPRINQGGTEATGSVFLDRTAPFGGITVELRQYQFPVDLPEEVFIPAGQSSAEFPVGIPGVCREWASTIEARLGLTAARQSVAIGPAPGGCPGVSGFSVGIPGSGGEDSLTPGAPQSGTLVLTSPAPASGTVLMLSSDDPGVLVPASVTLAAGESVAVFPVEVLHFCPPRLVRITATLGNAGEVRPVQVEGGAACPELADFSITPLRSTNAAELTGTVTLQAPAPNGGARVALSTFSDLLVLPPHVDIAPGEQAASFPVGTRLVDRERRAMVAASLGSSRRETPVDLGPASVSRLISLTTNRLHLANGEGATATLQLDGAFGVAGVSVQLRAEPPGVLSLPATVTFGNAVSQSFGFNALPVPTDTPVTLIAELYGDSRAVGLVVLATASGPRMQFGDWLAGSGLNGNAFADPGQRGVPLALRYAFGLDPLLPLADTALQVETVAGGSGLRGTFRWPRASSDLTVMVEWSNDLRSWQPLGPGAPLLRLSEPEDPTHDRFEFIDSSGDTTGTRHYRLNLTVSAPQD